MATTDTKAPTHEAAQLPPELARPLAAACKTAVQHPPEWMTGDEEDSEVMEKSEARGWWAVEGAKWLKDVCELLKVDISSLPDNPTGADIHPPAHATDDYRLQLATTLLSFTLFPPSTTTSTVSPATSPKLDYPATQRALLSRALSFLLIPTRTLLEAERLAALQLMREVESKAALAEKTEEARKSKEEGWGGSWGRWAATGGGILVGGLAIGITGGLAAPALLPFIPFLTASTAPAVLGTLFGLAGGGLAGKRVRARWAGVEEFEFVQISGGKEHEAPSLTATIFIPGITLNKPTDSLDTSRGTLLLFTPPRDVFHLVHSPTVMLATGKAVSGFLTAQVLGRIKKEIIARTALNAVMAAVALPMTIYGTAGTVVDNQWIRGCDKAKKAGDLLADVLLEKVQGDRPVVLIASSLGALTLFRALLKLSTSSLSQSKAPLIDTAILISMPLSPSSREWASARRAVARRLVNAWSENDLVLAGIGRLGEVMGGRTGWNGMAGLRKVGRDGVEDVDLSSVLGGHFEIQHKMNQILTIIGLDK